MLKTKGEKIFDVINVILMCVLILVFVVPFLVIVCSSFTSEQALVKYGTSLIIHEFSLENYKFIFSRGSAVLRAFGISVLITVITTVLTVAVNVLLAYPLSKKGFVGKKFFNVYIVITMLFGGGMIPFYLLIEKMNLLNNLWSLILPIIASAWNVILLRNYFAGIPSSLEEAAKIDGATNWQILKRVYLPLSMPVIATVALFAAVNQWNSWTTTRMFIDPNHSELYPLQYLIHNMINDVNNLTGTSSESDVSQIGVQNAAIVVATVPILMIYPALQKYFINGVIVGSVKE